MATLPQKGFIVNISITPVRSANSTIEYTIFFFKFSRAKGRTTGSFTAEMMTSFNLLKLFTFLGQRITVSMEMSLWDDQDLTDKLRTLDNISASQDRSL